MHIPVLTEKILEYTDPKPNENFIDCTGGGGGHTFQIAERTAPKGKILVLDWDAKAIAVLKNEVAKRKLQNRITLVQENFAHVQDVARQYAFQPIAGILFDLGFSSDQLERERGLSFQKDEILDMRYSDENPITAQKIVNYSSRNELERILEEYGEEQFAEKIAQAIVQNRREKPITRTAQLVAIIQNATPKSYHTKKINPATKTFQALRIATNNELKNIAQGLKGAQNIVAPNGKIAVISFHSIEDRIVKEFFKSQESLRAITKKPITPSDMEIKNNSRARSAKLRVAIKL